MQVRRCVGQALFLVLALHASGCGGGGVDQKSFDRLKVGMSPQEIEAILGKGGKPIGGEEIAALMKEAFAPQAGMPSGFKMEPANWSGAKGIRWGDDEKSITVIFMSDRASRIFKKGF